MAARSKVWFCCCSPAEVTGSNPAGRHRCLSLVCIVCCQVKASATGRSFVQRRPTERGVSECDREAQIMTRTCPTRGFRAMGRKRERKKPSGRGRDMTFSQRCC